MLDRGTAFSKTARAEATGFLRLMRADMRESNGRNDCVESSR
jgi:hypothetical protein